MSKNNSPSSSIADEWQDATLDLAQGSNSSDMARNVDGYDEIIEESNSDVNEDDEDGEGSNRSSGIGSFIDAFNLHDSNYSENDTSNVAGDSTGHQSNSTFSSGIGSFVHTSNTAGDSIGHQSNGTFSSGIGSFVHTANTTGDSTGHQSNSTFSSGIGSFVDVSNVEKVDVNEPDQTNGIDVDNSNVLVENDISIIFDAEKEVEKSIEGSENGANSNSESFNEAMDAVENIIHEQSISGLEQDNDREESQNKESYQEKDPTNIDISIDLEGCVEKKTESDDGLNDVVINKDIHHLSIDAAEEMEGELEDLSTEDLAKLTKQFEELSQHVNKIESKTTEPAEKETLQTDMFLDQHDILTDEAPTDGTPSNEGETAETNVTEENESFTVNKDEEEPKSESLLQDFLPDEAPTDGAPTNEEETAETNVTEKNESFAVSKDEEEPKRTNSLQDRGESYDNVGQLNGLPDPEKTTEQDDDHKNEKVLSVPQAVGVINDDKQSDMYYVSGCESSVSRASNFSQYTQFTTESAVTTKHKNTTANNWMGDDFSVISENHNMQATISLMTTLETEEYRKERDRLEIRKIALSNAYKSASGENADTFNDHLNVIPNNSYATLSMPPPPPPPPTIPTTATIAPGFHPSTSVHTGPPSVVHKEVEMKTFDKFQNGKEWRFNMLLLFYGSSSSHFSFWL